MVEQFAREWTPTVSVSWEGVEQEIREGSNLIEITRRALDGADFYQELDEDGIKVAATRAREIMRDAKDIYSYAVEGKYNDRWLNDEMTDDSIRRIATFALWARPAAEDLNGAVPVQCEKILVMAALRAGLDQAVQSIEYKVVRLGGASNHMTLFEMAILAQMNEKSVRNATQPTAQDRLKTTRLGTRTVVRAPDALEWLSRRRSFKATEIPRVLS